MSAGSAEVVPGRYRLGGRVVGELADVPVRERTPRLRRARGGRLDDELHVISADQAGMATAHLGSPQAGPCSLNAWITSRTVSSSAATSRAIARIGVSGRRRHDDHRPNPDRLMALPAARSAAAADPPGRSTAVPGPVLPPEDLTHNSDPVAIETRQTPQLRMPTGVSPDPVNACGHRTGGRRVAGRSWRLCRARRVGVGARSAGVETGVSV